MHMHIHKDISKTKISWVYRAVGVSTAAFVVAMLEGSTQPGVWFPEEVSLLFPYTTLRFVLFSMKNDVEIFFLQPQGIAVEAREALLKRASQGTFNFILNKLATSSLFADIDSLYPLCFV